MSRLIGSAVFANLAIVVFGALRTNKLTSDPSAQVS